MTPHLLRAACLAALLASPLAAPARAQSMDVPICDTRESAQMLLQSGPRGALPEGCRIAVVHRMDTQAGPVCRVDINPGTGIAGAVRDAVATTEWWTACANLRAP